MKLETQISWQNLFSPESIAVIGASNTPGSWGHTAIQGLLATGGRRIYAVNPNAAEVLGVKTYPSVVDIPDSIDLAVIVVTARLVPMVLHECVAKAIKAAIIITSGFAETGEQGQELEDELARIAREGGISFIGPNSMGHAVTRSNLSTFGHAREMTTGSVALLSQSGGTCLGIVSRCMESGVNFSQYISTGNETNLRTEDYLEYLAQDDDTKIIAAYIEGLRDGRRFYELAKEITVHKPIVVIKVGGTEESAIAVRSHTAALAGADAVYTAAFKQSGVIRVDDDEELCDVLYALLNCQLPRGNRIGILSAGGGQAAMTAEVCVKEGLAIGQLEPSTVEKLEKHLPSRWARRNPVDMSGPSMSDFAAISNMLLPLIEDVNTDAIFVLAPIVMDMARFAGRMGYSPEDVRAYKERQEQNLRLIGEKIEKHGKLVVLLGQYQNVTSNSEYSAIFRRARILVYPNVRRAAKVIRHLDWYKKYLDNASG
jgi:acyl-CoA synthetase (NDP forming)